MSLLQSTIDRDLRNNLKKKQDRVYLKKGSPAANKMKEGVSEFYEKDGNIVEWIKFGNKLYKSEFMSENIGDKTGAKKDSEGTEFFFPNGMIFHIGKAVTTNTSTTHTLLYEFPNSISYVFVCEHDSSYGTESRGYPIDDVRDKIMISTSTSNSRNHVYLVIGN